MKRWKKRQKTPSVTARSKRAGGRAVIAVNRTGPFMEPQDRPVRFPDTAFSPCARVPSHSASDRLNDERSSRILMVVDPGAPSERGRLPCVSHTGPLKLFPSVRESYCKDAGNPMTEFVLLFILAFAAIVLLYSLISRRLEGTVITAQMVFVAAGLLLSPAALGLIDTGEGTGTILIIAEIALVLTLFSDAARIDFKALLRGRMLPIRLLVIGLPLTILLGGLVAAGMLPDITLAEAALIGAVLAPTDAALGQAIVTNRRIPVKIRQALNVESGLNDGGAIPFFYFFLAIAVAEASGAPEQSLAMSALVLIGIGIVVGLVVGFLGTWLVDAAEKRGWMTGTFKWIAFLALALIAWVTAESLGGSGFIAAFVGGLAVAASGRDIGEAALEFAETEGQVLNLAVFFILGLFAATLMAGFSVAGPALRGAQPDPDPHDPRGRLPHRDAAQPVDGPRDGLVRAAGTGLDRAPADHLRRRRDPPGDGDRPGGHRHHRPAQRLRPRDQCRSAHTVVREDHRGPSRRRAGEGGRGD